MGPKLRSLRVRHHDRGCLYVLDSGQSHHVLPLKELNMNQGAKTIFCRDGQTVTGSIRSMVISVNHPTLNLFKH